MDGWQPDVNVLDRSPIEKRKRLRSWREITGITLHQTGIHGFAASAWPRATCHLGVHSDGHVYWVHPLRSLIWASDAFNRDTVAIEVAGNFRGDEAVPGSFWAGGGGPSQLSEAMIAGLRNAIRFIVDEAKRGGGAISHIYAHRQAIRGKSLCPGQQIWRAGGVWARETLRLSSGGPGYTRGDGLPIPAAWDGAAPRAQGPAAGDSFDVTCSTAELDQEFPDPDEENCCMPDEPG